MDNLLDKIRKIREKVSHIDFRMVIPSLLSSLKGIEFNNGKIVKSNIFANTNMTSPERQTLYILGLFATTEQKEIVDITESEFNDLLSDIKSVCNSYYADFYEDIFSNKDNYDLNKINESRNALEAFVSYFDMGTLRYPEQTLDLIEKIYIPFSDVLEKEKGISIQDLILFNNSVNEIFSKSAYAYSNIVLNKAGLKIGKDYGYLLCFSKEDLYEYIDPVKADILLDLFSIERKERPFYYYNDPNPVAERPLFKLADNKYFISNPTLVTAAMLIFCTNYFENKDRNDFDIILKKKGKIVENLFKEQFERIFGDNAIIHASVCEKPKDNEHDILIEYKNYIFICEIKSSKIRIPFFNLEKGFERLKRDFNSKHGIGYAYQQAIKLKKVIEHENSITLYENYNKPFVLKCCHRKEIIPIVCTLYSYGLIGINASNLLIKDEKEPYPWVVNYIDLTDIGEINDYLNKGADDFASYIDFRSRNYKFISAQDELGILEMFYSDKNFRNMDNVPFMVPISAGNLMDKIYFEKHGFSYDYKLIGEDDRYVDCILSRNRTYIRKNRKIGNNELCPCGSGKKFKKCCKGKGIYD